MCHLRAQLVPLDRRVSGEDEAPALVDQLADPTNDPVACDPTEDLARLVLAASRRIDPRAREVIRKTILEGQNLAEVGKSLGVTESRVSQIRTKALRTLRELMEIELRGEDLGVPAVASQRFLVPT
jgi:RNA polymerase sigma factor for flagellar operon FliA